MAHTTVEVDIEIGTVAWAQGKEAAVLFDTPTRLGDGR